MNTPGFEQTLRHALHTELTLRLRHTLLHGLKGPVQTILSALHLMQKKALAGETQDLDKYANWIKDAAKDLTTRAQEVLPPKPLPPGQTASFDLHALTEEVAHVLRDEGALKNVELAIEPATAPMLTRGNEGDVRLALLAVMLRLVDASPADSPISISIKPTGSGVRWSAALTGGERPGDGDLEPRYDVALPQSGIAWPVSRGIIRDNGGTLSVADHAQNGWHVEFTLPAG